MKSLDELIRIAHAGGGLDLTGTDYSTDDMIRLAAVSARKGARLVISGGNRPTDDLIRISAAGRGVVTVDFSA